MRPFGIAAVSLAALFFGGCSTTPSEPPASTYLLGEKVQVGHLSYTAFETQWVTQLGDGPAPRIPENRFFLVRLSTVNGGSEDISVPNVSVEDDKGKRYEELSNGEGVAQWAGYLRSVHPADSVQGNVVFDAPPGHYKLRVWDEAHSRSALIDIPLSFGAETPDLPAPDATKQ